MSPEMPAVSVIIPSFNRRKELSHALRSALRQTVRPKEIIVIDDGSSDGTAEFVKRLSESNREINLIVNEENLGSGASRNVGIEEASGEFISFLDSDDVYPDSGSLEKMYGLAVKNNVSVCGSLRELKKEMKHIKTEDFRKECSENPEGPILTYRNYQQDYDFTSYIFRRDFLMSGNIRFPEYRRYQDVPFLVKSLLKAEKFCIAPVCGYRYTIHRKNPVEYNNRNTEDLIKSMTETLRLASENNLPMLLKRTVGRLNREYGGFITQNYIKGNKSIPALLREAECSIDRNLEDCGDLHIELLDELGEVDSA